MSTKTRTKTITSTFEIVSTDAGYAITYDDFFLRDWFGKIRVFVTRNSARKRISRERRGNFHD